MMGLPSLKRKQIGEFWVMPFFDKAKLFPAEDSQDLKVVSAPASA